MGRIELQGVGMTFSDGTEALRDVSLTIEDGERFVLVGPSGCGKSTLLLLVAGLERPTEGRILVDGRPVDHLDPRDRNMAMVFQSYALYPHLTVRENLAFPLRMAGRDRQTIAERVEEVARTLAIGDLLDRRPKQLSGGQRQRVAMGRAMVREPVAFLMDEPLSNLDARLRTRMRAEIAHLQRRLDTTLVYVTHDQAEAMTLGDRIALLKDGRLQQVGTPRELYEQPANAFVATFLGSPPMNLFRRDGQLLGLRPEAAALEGDFHLRGTVVLVEWLGAEALVQVELADAESDEPFVARWPSPDLPTEGQDVTLAFSSGAVHAF